MSDGHCPCGACRQTLAQVRTDKQRTLHRWTGVCEHPEHIEPALTLPLVVYATTNLRARGNIGTSSSNSERGQPLMASSTTICSKQSVANGRESRRRRSSVVMAGLLMCSTAGPTETYAESGLFVRQMHSGCDRRTHLVMLCPQLVQDTRRSQLWLGWSVCHHARTSDLRLDAMPHHFHERALPMSLLPTSC